MSVQTTQNPKKAARRGPGDFFNGYFKNFPSVLLANLVFAIPLAASAAIIWGLSFLITPNIFIQLLPVILCAPFYAGITQCTRDMVNGRKKRLFSSFTKGVKTNLKQFLVHGVIFYLAILLDYFSIVFYYAAGATNPLFYILFGICMLILLFLVFMFFYVPVITVTLDLPMRYVYKDAALMALWELPSNFLSLLCLVVLTAVVSTVFMLTGNYTANLVIAAVLVVTVLPAAVSYIINFFVYPKVDKMLINKSGRQKDSAGTETPLSVEEALQNAPVPQEILEQKAGGNTEYVFHNGKMIKREKLEAYYNHENTQE